MNSLLLQGPVGPLFKGLARALAARGDRVRHIVFNGGDVRFASRRHAIPYRSTPEQWPDFLRRALRAWEIDRVFLFGDCRPLHRTAIAICREAGIPVYVFEEGYLRPAWMTLELGGVNGHSRLPRDPAAYAGIAPRRTPDPRACRFTMLRRIATCWIYWMALHAGDGRFPGYRHHRGTSPAYETVCWLRSGLRKWTCRWRERGWRRRVAERPFFLVPLQVEGDSQVRFHSRFASVADFIREVVASFAAHAPAAALLVVKHHPMDRGYHDYRGLLAELAAAHGLGDRILYLHDQPLPHLLNGARGVVLINSTVGISALLHRRPVIALGDAVFALPGLVHDGGLDGFWAAPRTPDHDLFLRFRQHLLDTTQFAGTSVACRADWTVLDRLPAGP
ncbi:MAG: Capsule polysaccharide export protein kpsS [Planctomycetota bacterium]|jgi:capsular polysaccharide export protein